PRPLGQSRGPGGAEGDGAAREQPEEFLVRQSVGTGQVSLDRGGEVERLPRGGGTGIAPREPQMRGPRAVRLELRGLAAHPAVPSNPAPSSQVHSSPPLGLGRRLGRAPFPPAPPLASVLLNDGQTPGAPWGPTPVRRSTMSSQTRSDGRPVPRSSELDGALRDAVEDFARHSRKNSEAI